MIRFVHTPPPVDETAIFENPFHPNLQHSRSEKVEFFKDPQLVAAWMYEDDVLVGEMYGLPDEEDADCLYCHSSSVLGMGKGRGTLLKAHWLGLAKGLGFKRVAGHARPGASQALNRKFGAQFIEECPDWYETGETYGYYILELE